MRSLPSAVLLAALVACTPGVDAQLDELADDVAALSEENAVLATQNDELSRTLDAVEAELISVEAQLDEVLATCLDDTTTSTTPEAPTVRLGAAWSAGVASYTVRVDGVGITAWEVVAAEVFADVYTVEFWDAPSDECTFFVSKASNITVWTWQDHTATCHGYGAGCRALVLMPPDEVC